MLFFRLATVPFDKSLRPYKYVPQLLPKRNFFRSSRILTQMLWTQKHHFGLKTLRRRRLAGSIFLDLGCQKPPFWLSSASPKACKFVFSGFGVSKNHRFGLAVRRRRLAGSFFGIWGAKNHSFGLAVRRRRLAGSFVYMWGVTNTVLV